MLIDNAQKNTVQRKGKATVLEGVVVSDKMKNTAVVAVERFVKHPKYQKFMKITKRFKADNPENAHKVGEKVRIEACRPISREKFFKIV